MGWKISYSETAAKQLEKLDKGIQRKVKNFMAEVAELDDPSVRGHDLSGPLAGLHRYRIGQIRIIVSIGRTTITITVAKIDRRDSIY